jgi:hypothetical protein
LRWVSLPSTHPTALTRCVAALRGGLSLGRGLNIEG